MTTELTIEQSYISLDTLSLYIIAMSPGYVPSPLAPAGSRAEQLAGTIQRHFLTDCQMPLTSFTTLYLKAGVMIHVCHFSMH